MTTAMLCDKQMMHSCHHVIAESRQYTQSFLYKFVILHPYSIKSLQLRRLIVYKKAQGW